MKLSLVLLAFLVIGLLLASAHWGFAVRVMNWMYWLLGVIAVVKLASK